MVVKKRKPGQGSQNHGRQSSNNNSNEENNNEDDGDEEDGDDGDDEDDDDAKFTQADLDRITTREKSKAARAAGRAMLKELGFESAADLKAALEKKSTPAKKAPAKKDDEDEDDDTPSAAEIRKEVEAEASKRIKALELDTLISETIVDEYGLTMKAARKIRRMLDVDADATADDITEALEELEEEMPSLFKQDSESDDDEEDAGRKRNRPERRSQKSAGRSSNPGRSPQKKQSAGSVQKAARTLLHERHPQLNKK